MGENVSEETVESGGSRVSRLIGLLFSRTAGLFKPGEFGDFDLWCLKVAMLVSALDGKVVDNETLAFEKLARKCRGWTPEAAEKALDEGLHAAGYLMLQSQRLGEDELIAEFVRECERSAPAELKSVPVFELRRMFVMWSAMALADKTYSPIERKALAELRKRLDDLTDGRTTKAVSESFLREVERQLDMLRSEDTLVGAVGVLKAFIDL